MQDIASYLCFGMKLTATIEFAIDDKRDLSCNFIGLKHKHYLLFELSLKSVDTIFIQRTKGTSIIVRGFSNVGEGHVVAFKSRVIRIQTAGSVLMFVEFPAKVESKPIRTYKRYNVSFEAMTTIDTKTYAGTLIDISKSGCALMLKNKKINVELGLEIQIEPEMKYIQKPYPKCFVVNARQSKDGTVLGIRFEHELYVSDDLKLEVLENVIL